ncbi:hypothetical protein ACZ90_54100 [Streptomyces albus subsp. albus]|nr:hypothetical protein ACZ90_54100 [Streptomyces albus subsp. albus]
MRAMLFRISESGWWLIAVLATVFFVIGMRAMSLGMELPEDGRGTLELRNKQARRAFTLLTPVVAAAVLGTSLLRPGPASPILFLYSVAFTAIPVALFPVRGRLVKSYVAQQQDPGSEIKPDRLATAWICAVLSAAILAAVLALMTTRQGVRG